jgi:hypothetical protein
MSRGNLPCPYGNKRTSRFALQPSAAGSLISSGESDARVN